MNEFEWSRQMRALRTPVVPQRDLWASIDAALDEVESASDRSRFADTVPDTARRTMAHRRWMVAGSLAASLLLACGVGWQLGRKQATVVAANGATAPAPWKPSDPRLAGAAVELDAARMELQQAMQQAPGSPALQRILVRTEHQQTQLRQLGREAS
jgi:hypothetical protein